MLYRLHLKDSKPDRTVTEYKAGSGVNIDAEAALALMNTIKAGCDRMVDKSGQDKADQLAKTLMSMNQADFKMCIDANIFINDEDYRDADNNQFSTSNGKKLFDNKYSSQFNMPQINEKASD